MSVTGQFKCNEYNQKNEYTHRRMKASCLSMSWVN